MKAYNENIPHDVVSYENLFKSSKASKKLSLQSEKNKKIINMKQTGEKVLRCRISKTCPGSWVATWKFVNTKLQHSKNKKKVQLRFQFSSFPLRCDTENYNELSRKLISIESFSPPFFQFSISCCWKVFNYFCQFFERITVLDTVFSSVIDKTDEGR